MGFVFLEDMKHTSSNTCEMTKEVSPKGLREQKTAIQEPQNSGDNPKTEAKFLITERKLYQVRRDQEVKKSLTKKQNQEEAIFSCSLSTGQ